MGLFLRVKNNGVMGRIVTVRKFSHTAYGHSEARSAILFGQTEFAQILWKVALHRYESIDWSFPAFYGRERELGAFSSKNQLMRTVI